MNDKKWRPIEYELKLKKNETMTQREEFTLGDTVNHVFCDTVCEPVCGRKKTLSGYVDTDGIPCSRNCCTLFNQFADNVDKAFYKYRKL